MFAEQMTYYKEKQTHMCDLTLYYEEIGNKHTRQEREHAAKCLLEARTHKGGFEQVILLQVQFWDQCV